MTQTLEPTTAPTTPRPTSPGTTYQSWFTTSALGISAVALGGALQVNYGQYHPLALLWLTVALLATAAAVLIRGTASSPRCPLDLWVLGAGLLVQLILLLARNPTATFRADDATALLPFRLGVLAAGALVALSILARGFFRHALLSLLLAAHFAMGLWVLAHTPSPGVDVYTFQRDACAALLAGKNPYAMTYPDAYRGDVPIYAPGVSVNRRLQFGYPYPLLTLLLTLPGYLLGDIRYAHLLAMTLSGALILFGLSNRDDPHGQTRATLAAGLLLFTPRGFFVLEASWTEPFVVMLLCATVCVARRSSVRLQRDRSLLAPVLGVLCAAKQYLVLLAPVIALLARRGDRGHAWRLLLVAGSIATALTLPLALWDPPAFVRSVVSLQFHQPFRSDALSYVVPLASATGLHPPSWVGLVFVIPTIVLTLWRHPRTPRGFVTGVALVYFVFFAFNKQAFCNYYYFVIGALCCAIAAPDKRPASGAANRL